MGMSHARNTFVTLALLAAAAAVFAAGARAAVVPLRTGTVLSTTDSKGFTLIKAVDEGGKQFWVLTSICTVGEKGSIAVLAGAHHDKLRTEQSGVIEDVYIGDQVRLGGTEVVGFGAHALPQGCVVIE